MYIGCKRTIFMNNVIFLLFCFSFDICVCSDIGFVFVLDIFHMWELALSCTHLFNVDWPSACMIHDHEALVAVCTRAQVIPTKPWHKL